MKKNKSIIIFGSGRRTQQDILPALDYLKFPKNKIIIYAKNNKTIVSRNHTFLVKSIKECTEINNDDLIYIAVSTVSQIKVLEFVQKINANSKIIIDTPANFKLIKNESLKSISISEDVVPLLSIMQKRKVIKKLFFNFLFFRRSAFKYHAISFIEHLNGPIFFQIKFLSFQLHFSHRGIAIILFERNYEKGSIYMNFKNIEFPNQLSESEKKLIGGSGDYDTFSSRFLELKRIGLAELILNAMNNDPIVSVYDGIKHVKKSKIMNKKIGINFFYR
jgi:hypothetical protein